jgi:hypothetical protein
MNMFVEKSTLDDTVALKAIIQDLMDPIEVSKRKMEAKSLLDPVM